MCDCEDGWGGEFCDVDTVDDCLSEPCENGGSCTDDLNKHTCSCSPPWIGQTCSSSEFAIIVIMIAVFVVYIGNRLKMITVFHNHGQKRTGPDLE